ncbi:hypothetical protein E3N88_29695 [Mikania micrantha]|uniref:Uncharacterized protein n=1 Tax=Mikania micrantha TaxID=192012 RepID=A0A5N6MKA0_9ASTR|nr:hypothetical protein E3N88_29695 [Mikania micrantha]
MDHVGCNSKLRFLVSPLTTTATAGNHHSRRRRRIPATAANRCSEWKAVKKNLGIAKGFKTGSLYLVPVPSGEVTNPVKTNAKVGLADSRVKRVKFTAKNSGTSGNQLEHIRRIPVSDGASLWESIGIEDEKTWSVMTGLLKLLDDGVAVCFAWRA